MRTGVENDGGRQRRRTAWASARVRLLGYWDHPPAVLFWLVFTTGTIVILKGIGL